MYSVRAVPGKKVLGGEWVEWDLKIGVPPTQFNLPITRTVRWYAVRIMTSNLFIILIFQW